MVLALGAQERRVKIFTYIISSSPITKSYSEVQSLKVKDLIHHMNPPCAKCPYKLGLVQTLINPCPQCKENGYQTFERFQKQASGDGPISGEERE